MTIEILKKKIPAIHEHINYIKDDDDHEDDYCCKSKPN